MNFTSCYPATTHEIALEILRSKLIKANGPVLTATISSEMNWKSRFKRDLFSFEKWAKTLPPEEFIFIYGEAGNGTISYNFSNLAALRGVGTSQISASDYTVNTRSTGKIDDVNILSQWATNGVGKKLIEKFGFSEKDIPAGPIEATVLHKGQGLGYQHQPYLGGINEKKMTTETLIGQNFVHPQQNLNQVNGSDHMAWYEDKTPAPPSMPHSSSSSYASAGVESENGFGTNSAESTTVGSKRKAPSIEQDSHSSSGSGTMPHVQVLHEKLSMFLRELQQQLVNGQVSKEWAAALLLDAARAVILSNDLKSGS